MGEGADMLGREADGGRGQRGLVSAQGRLETRPSDAGRGGNRQEQTASDRSHINSRQGNSPLGGIPSRLFQRLRALPGLLPDGRWRRLGGARSVVAGMRENILQPAGILLIGGGETRPEDYSVVARRNLARCGFQATSLCCRKPFGCDLNDFGNWSFSGRRHSHLLDGHGRHYHGNYLNPVEFRFRRLFDGGKRQISTNLCIETPVSIHNHLNIL